MSWQALVAAALVIQTFVFAHQRPTVFLKLFFTVYQDDAWRFMSSNHLFSSKRASSKILTAFSLARSITSCSLSSRLNQTARFRFGAGNVGLPFWSRTYHPIPSQRGPDYGKQ